MFLGTTDPATSLALREARRSDPTGARSTGIITKVDLVGDNKDSLVNLLLGVNGTHCAGGRFGVRCRTQQEQLENVSFEEVIEREATWIAETNLREHPLFNPLTINLGVPAMRHELSQSLLASIVKEIPKLILALNQKIAEAKHNEGFLRRLADEPNLHTVSMELEVLVNQLHPASDSRRTFEENLKHRLSKVVHEVVNTARTRSIPSKFLAKADDMAGPSQIVQVHSNKNTIVPNEHARKLLESLDYEPTSNPKTQLSKYNELTLFGGESHMDRWKSAELNDITRRGTIVGLFGEYFHQILPKHPRQARSEWVKGMETLVSEMLKKNTTLVKGEEPLANNTNNPNEGLDLVERCFDAFTDELSSFSQRAAETSTTSSSSAELARLYFRYLTGNIASKIKKNGLAKEMEGMVAREKRPIPDFLAIQNELAKNLLYPQPNYGILANLFGDDGNKQKMSVTVFNEEWTDAYLALVEKRISDDMFRIQAVRLLERLVFESISFSLNMFAKGDSVKHEAHSQSKEAARLEMCRDVLQQALDESEL